MQSQGHNYQRAGNGIMAHPAGGLQGLSTPGTVPRRFGGALTPSCGGAPNVRGYPSPVKQVSAQEERGVVVYAGKSPTPKATQRVPLAREPLPVHTLTSSSPVTRSHASDANPSSAPAPRVMKLRKLPEFDAIPAMPAPPDNVVPTLPFAVASDVPQRSAAVPASALIEEQLHAKAAQYETQVAGPKWYDKHCISDTPADSSSMARPITKEEAPVTYFSNNESKALSWFIEPNMHSMVADSERSFVEYCFEQLQLSIDQEGGLVSYLRRCSQALADDLTGAELASADLAAELSSIPELDAYLSAEDPAVISRLADFLAKALESLIQRLCRNGSDGVFVMKGTAFSQGGKKLIKVKVWCGDSCAGETGAMQFSVCWDWDVKLELESLNSE